MDALSQETIAILGVGVVLAGFFWSLHRDVAILRERTSRLEGLFEGLRDSVNRLEHAVRSSRTPVRRPVSAVPRRGRLTCTKDSLRPEVTR